MFNFNHLIEGCLVIMLNTTKKKTICSHRKADCFNHNIIPIAKLKLTQLIVQRFSTDNEFCSYREADCFKHNIIQIAEMKLTQMIV